MLRVKNWDKFQHYKNRNPPWIKLHVTLLDDSDFWSLSPESCRVLIALWLLSSQCSIDGVIDLDSKALAWRLRLASNVLATCLQELQTLGFIEETGHASNMLATCKQHASPETETEAKTERETETERARDPFESSFAQFPERVVEAYREHCPNLPPPAPGWRRGSTGAGILRLSDEIGQELGAWVDVFQIANKAAFLREKRLGLDWLVKTPENWQNTASGRYSDAERSDPFAVLEGGAA